MNFSGASIKIRSAPNGYFVSKPWPNWNTGKSFELTVALNDDCPDTVRIVMMHHYGQEEYSAKGIPDSLLPVVKRALRMSVESSPRHGTTNDVYRTDAATAVWERLLDNGLATYDAQRDVYVLL